MSGWTGFWQGLVYGKSDKRARDEIGLAVEKGTADIELRRREAEMGLSISRRQAEITQGYMKYMGIGLLVVVAGFAVWKLA